MSLLEIVILLFLILWLLGVFVAPIAGSLVHVLLIVVVVLVIVRLLTGRQVL